jgi:predicted enzyme related to lactoylglutathione lyase
VEVDVRIAILVIMAGLLAVPLGISPSAAGEAASSSSIVFFDIAGPDSTQLSQFYTSVFGWQIDQKGAITTASGLKGTLRQDPPEKIIYIGVPDINAALAKIKASGGNVVLPRTIIPNDVVFALFTDPAGNRMGLVEKK